MSPRVEVPLPFGDEAVDPIRRIPVASLPGVSVPLYRVGRGDDAPRGPVLLVHGGSAWSHSFTVPRGRGLADHLVLLGFDVFLLDWRASKHVCAIYGPDEVAFEATTLEDAALHELPGALREIQRLRRDERPIPIVAHCFGAGMTSIGIACGALGGLVERVVLLTLGLFYDVPWDGVLKGEDHLLERVRVVEGSPSKVHAIDSRPATGFPGAVKEAYGIWPSSALPTDAPEQFRRLAFMFGVPYLVENVPAELHTATSLEAQFGEMHLRLFQHGVQNVRRGFAAPFDAVESVSDTHDSTDPIAAGSSGGRVLATGTRPSMHAFLELSPWTKLRRVALITGERNSLWHRTAIDSMYDFLRRALPPRVCTKQVLRGYAHQDLLWGAGAVDDVFPSIVAAIGD